MASTSCKSITRAKNRRWRAPEYGRGFGPGQGSMSRALLLLNHAELWWLLSLTMSKRPLYTMKKLSKKRMMAFRRLKKLQHI